MDVVGIVQTDLNEFNILFDEGQQGQGQGQGQDQGQNQQQGQNGSGEDDNLFSFLSVDPSQDQGQKQGQGQQGQQGQNQSLQEMTVRIKGIPEGQKATFLQMYQVIQDAKGMQDLEHNLTIVSNGTGSQQQKNNNKHSQKGQMTQRSQSNQQGSTGLGTSQ
ncbi:MAG: hypothetical protein ACM32O_04645 [Clostridia bacterium]